MSKSAAPEQGAGYGQCNGSIKDSIKLAVEKGVTPNGIHALPENKQQKSMEVTERKEESEKEAALEVENDIHAKELIQAEDKSTNQLIDEFSTAMALSMIHSSETHGFGNAGDSGGDNKLDVTTPEIKNSTCETEVDVPDNINKSEAAADSTEVEYPMSKTSTTENAVAEKNGVKYLRYESELQMSAIMQLITKDLSEPYSIYTYRYFIHNWPHLCFLAMHESTYVGAIVCKLDLHKKITRRGYIAMLAVDQSVRRRNIGTNLVKMAIEAMNQEGCDEVVLETEVTNKPALKLYENLGFVRDKRLFRYYLNGVDALRLKLWLR